MANNYNEQRKFGDSHMMQVRKILNYLYTHKVFKSKVVQVDEGTFEEDTVKAIDLVVSFEDGSKTTVALRVRKLTHFRDVTFRYTTAYGYGTSEFKKMNQPNCHVKWYLYCWTDGTGKIIEWVVLDIDTCRKHNLFIIRPAAIPNSGAEDSSFVAYNIESLRNWETWDEKINLIACSDKV